MTKVRGLVLLLAAVVCVSVYVGPVREALMNDDWAYALSVRHLLATGEYRLNDWAAANMPVQIYWAALLAHLFGYTFTVLRFSTLALLLVALLSLYLLLRDAGAGDDEASLLTLAMLAGPAVLFLSFTFQTDVQFLAWQALALWLYGRALRSGSYSLVIAGSMAAAAATGTRQFGVALVVGLLTVWAFVERKRLRSAVFYLAGLALPAAAAIWQFYLGIDHPTFSQRLRLAEQRQYMADVPRLLGDFFWRPIVIIQYLALYLLPLLPLLLLIAARASCSVDPAHAGLNTAQLFRKRKLLELAICACYITAGICFGYFFYLPRVLMPYLGWLLRYSNESIGLTGLKTQLALTLVTGGLAVFISWIIFFRWPNSREWKPTPRSDRFIAFSGLALLGLQQIGRAHV